MTLRRILLVAGAAACGAVVLAGCTSSRGASGAVTCGTGKTAVGVPVVIEVIKGGTSCAEALRVEADYAAKIKAGDVRGTGGGAPVSVDGWNCQGFDTPQILATGDASRCRADGAEILAVLPVPSASPSPR